MCRCQVTVTFEVTVTCFKGEVAESIAFGHLKGELQERSKRMEVG